MSEKDKTFEEKLGELDDIVKRLETGDTTLDEMLSLFESGVKIAKECSAELDSAEKKINILVTDGEGEAELKPFAGEAEV